MPQVLVSLLEMGAPILAPGAERLNRSMMHAHDRPLTFELVERLLHWLVPLRERVAAVGLGRKQALVISAFLLAMTTYIAYHEYWSILSTQEEFFEEGKLAAIVEDSFAYLREQAYAVGGSTRTVAEAQPYLPASAGRGPERVVVVLLSGLRFDALAESSALQAWRDGVTAESLLCRLRSE
eukprot:3700887-Prymnesium_polylepis.1